VAVATTTTRDNGQQQHDNQHDNQYNNNTTTTSCCCHRSFASDDREEDRRCHRPARVGRGASDRVKEVTVFDTGGRLRHLAAMVGGEHARDDSG
jgi:hypothetical protein